MIIQFKVTGITPSGLWYCSWYCMYDCHW